MSDGDVSDGDVSWAARLRAGLSKSAARLGEGLSRTFTRRRLDAESLEELEDILIEADLGVETAGAVAGEFEKRHRGRDAEPEILRRSLAELIADRLRPVAAPLAFDPAIRPAVVLVIGVNGTGKTTTIGKMAKQETGWGRKVMIAAGDTFRAAAVEQLQVWGERAGAEVVTAPPRADAAGLAHDACTRAQAEGVDLLLIDTAGRLHTKSDLMAELEKIRRAVDKAIPGAPHKTLLVLDAGTGQNALTQTETFGATLPIDGLILTKLDGTARGGVVVALADRFGLPVHAVGVGERVEDLQPFSPDAFARALVGLED